MLFTILRHQPLAVDTAMNAAEAMERIRSCDYALILVDMSLADDDGAKFLRDFAETRPNATTFIIAVRDPASHVPVEPVVSAVLSKPLEIDTLAAVVRECAAVVPPPADPRPCPAAESDVREQMERSGSYYTN